MRHFVFSKLATSSIRVKWVKELAACESAQSITGDVHCHTQCLSQDLETGCLKLAVVKFLGLQIFKGDHNIIQKFNYQAKLEIEIFRNSTLIPDKYFWVS